MRIWTDEVPLSYVRLFRGTEHMHRRTFLAVGSWVGIIVTMWIIAWIIAESITVFNDLLGLISALFASWYVHDGDSLLLNAC